ncbi:MAG TPA: porin family protein [Acidobacteriota bacterium]|nr:porin family protein [Acidobacteriota bacterium]
MARTKLSILAGAAVLFVATGAGFAADVRLGFHGGISIPNLRGKDTDIFSRNFTSRRGPYFGLTADFPLASGFSLGLDLNFTSQGGVRRGMQPITMDLPDGLPIPPGTLLYADFRNETILDYLEVPVLARYTMGGKVRAFVEAGPYAGYLVRAKAVTAGVSALYLDEAGTMPIVIPPATEPLEVDLGAETNVRDSLVKFNVGVAGGAGVLIPFGAGELVLEARFQLGLTTLQKNPETDGHTQTGAIVVSVGYALPFTRHK